MSCISHLNLNMLETRRPLESNVSSALWHRKGSFYILSLSRSLANGSSRKESRNVVFPRTDTQVGRPTPPQALFVGALEVPGFSFSSLTEYMHSWNFHIFRLQIQLLEAWSAWSLVSHCDRRRSLAAAQIKLFPIIGKNEEGLRAVDRVLLGRVH